MKQQKKNEDMASMMESNIDQGINELGSLEFGGGPTGGGNMLESDYADTNIEPENEGQMY